eukprot:TRINITY_DN71330_c0_g1_i1.p1 TRINITY_DN71330_c0_g1~~TRINITY_DN71330_c0_g1_i1.p1  ORF type:complete len:389 (+),score=101.94 TRINITY_DN71330_c0_g1_i1:77-1168(+)
MPPGPGFGRALADGAAADCEVTCEPGPAPELAVPSPEHPQLPPGVPVWAVVVTYTTLLSSSSIVATLTKSAGGAYAYNPVAATLSTHTLKLAVSLLALRAQGRWPERLPAPGEVLPFAVPGIVYLIDDNLVFLALYWLRPSEFALFANARILTTAAFSRVLLNRRISGPQWSALTSLMLGLVVARLGAVQRSGDNLHGLNPGHFVLAIICVVGALGNVYCEKLLKAEPGDSLHLQNCKLYVFSVTFNAIACVSYGKRSGAPMLFGGWTAAVVALVIINAAVGLTNSVIFKFLDNLVKVQAAAGAVILTVVASALVFGSEPSPAFYVAVGIVGNAVYVFNHPQSRALQQQHGGDTPPAPSTARE